MARTQRKTGGKAGKEASQGRDTNERGITDAEVADVEDRATPRTPVIYEIVRRHGEEEMERPLVSLWWSGVAGGFAISFSLLSQAMLEAHLPDAPWRPLVSNFGYSVGFLIAVLARQQLFTESTITAVLPIFAKFSIGALARMGRMWAIVLIANFAGTLFAALFCMHTPVLAPELLAGMLKISHQLLELNWGAMFFRGISSGFLIAAMVWLIPSAEGAKFHVITLMTYLVALGGFTHIVAGSLEAFMLVLDGQWGFFPMVWGFMIPVLIGNTIGGTALFGLISYAQIMKEI